jgi:hypothetical protein
MKAEEFDKIFDDNKEDIIEYLDLSTIRRPNLEPKKMNYLDAEHRGINRF